MGVIVADDFNREAGTLGPPWTHVSGGGSRITPDGRLRSVSATSATIDVLPGDYPSEYRVQADVVRVSSAANTTFGLAGRYNSSSYYHVRWFDISGQWELYRFQGSFVLLDSWVAPFVTGTTHRVDLWLTNAAKRVYIDGVLRLSSTDNVLASGVAGVRGVSSNPVSDTQGVHIDNFRAVTLDHVDGGIPQPLLEGWI